MSAIAVTVSGEPMNDSVAALPSLRAGKLRLNDDTIVLRSPFVDVVALPLADARAARVREHRGADRLEVGEQAVALDGGAHLLRARRDQQRRLDPQARARFAWRATFAARPMSSYDEFVHEPTSA